MMTLILLFVGMFALFKVRQWLLYKPMVSLATDDTQGELFTFEKTAILRRGLPGANFSGSDDPSDSNQSIATIICFPGFMETSQYFTELYAEQPVELILINNCDYHNPFSDQLNSEIPWTDKIPYEFGSIAYDAALVNLVIEYLASYNRIIVHGHSRGGAVMLEAAKQRPAQFSNIDMVLESPVLPQARLPKITENLIQFGGLFLLPFVFMIINALPRDSRLRSPSLAVTNQRKTELLTEMASNPHNVDIVIRQIKALSQWPVISTYDLYQNARSITIVMGASDKVLHLGYMSHSAMYAEALSAKEGLASVRLVNTKNTDHFSTLESPEQMLAIINQILDGHKTTVQTAEQQPAPIAD